MNIKGITIFSLFALFSLGQEVIAQNYNEILPKLSIGIYARADFNSIKYKQPDLQLKVKDKSTPQISPNIYFSKGVSKNFLLDVIAGYGSAEYNISYSNSNGEARLIRSLQGFYQANAVLNWVVNPENFNYYFLVGAGATVQSKIFEQNTFINKEVPRSVWPNTNINPYFNVAFRTYFNNESFIQPMLGIKFSLQKQTIYERTLTQFNIGVIFGGSFSSLKPTKKSANQSKDKKGIEKTLKK